MSLNEYVTADQAARLLNYNVDSVRRLLRCRKLHAEKVGQTWLVPRKAVLAYQEAVRGMAKNDPRRGA